MSVLKPRPVGYQPPPRQHPLPSGSPSPWDTIRNAVRRRLADGPLGRFARYAYERNIYIVGSNASRCEIDPTATLSNAHINATSGVVRIRENVMLAPNVSLVAGTHDMTRTGQERRTAIPHEGHDITIEAGAFIATGATLIGPVTIGRDAVVAAGAVVTKDVPAGALAAGVPARVVKQLS